LEKIKKIKKPLLPPEQLKKSLSIKEHLKDVSTDILKKRKEVREKRKESSKRTGLECFSLIQNFDNSDKRETDSTK
jgi:hypothetical protein